MRQRSVIAVNTSDEGGGAERIATQLHVGIGNRGWKSSLLVGERKSDLDGVRSFHESECIDYRPITRGIPAWRTRLEKRLRQSIGLQDYSYPLSHSIPHFVGSRPDVIHFHNLHGGFFDLRALPDLSNRFPCVVTLEDCWWFSGHCAYSLDCDRWETGCGDCPLLETPPEPKRRDATRWNWSAKRSIFSRSRLFVVAPSHWLMDRAKASILAPAIEGSEVIPHGVDLNTFQPGCRKTARKSLGLPEQKMIIIFSANRGVSSPYKNFPLIREVAGKLGEMGKSALFIAIGEEGETESWGRVELRHVGYLKGEREMADYFRASDIYLHAARNEAFGIVLAEAMACGIPVVASAVDGIPEVVGEGGILFPPNDVSGCSTALMALTESSGKRNELGQTALARAKRDFDLKRMIGAYQRCYERLALDSSNRENSSGLQAE